MKSLFHRFLPVTNNRENTDHHNSSHPDGNMMTIMMVMITMNYYGTVCFITIIIVTSKRKRLQTDLAIHVD